MGKDMVYAQTGTQPLLVIPAGEDILYLLCEKGIFELGIPVLGICYGSQLMAHLLGGRVTSAPVSEYGKTEVEVDQNAALFAGVAGKTICWMSHTD